MTWTVKMTDARYDGYEEGLEQGRNQGAHQKALETARAMYLDKIPIETISKYTNLPLDVIQRLKESCET